MYIVNTAFAVNYQVDEPVFWSPSETVYNFLSSGGGEPFGAPTLELSITPDGAPGWRGRFFEGQSTVILGPGAETLIVPGEDVAFVVNVNAPSDYRVLALPPIRRWEFVAAHNLFLLANFTDIVAIGNGGSIAWVSKDLVGDGFTKFDVSGDTLRVAGDKWGDDIDITLDLASGAILP